MNFEEIASLILDETTNYIYLADPETYELYYINRALMQVLGYPEEKYWLKQPCYKVLQGKDAPCEFCTNCTLSDKEFHVWEHYNPVIAKDLTIKEKLVSYNNKKMRLEIAIDTTDKEITARSLQKKLDMEETQIQCIQTLNLTSDTKQAIIKLLAMIGDYHMADRAYIIEVDYTKNACYNTYEWCREGVTPQLKNLQQIPLSLLSKWFERFKHDGKYYINSTENELSKQSSEYQVLTAQQITSLLTVPLWWEGRIEGFLGVDNPNDNTDDMTLMQSVSSFIINDINKRKLMEQLTFLSYIDGLTKVGNRYKYNELISRLKQDKPERLGVVFIDVNGLKTANDTHGHEFGDHLILHTADVLKSIFADPIFRIGGDEFVVLCPQISKAEFNKSVTALRKEIQNDGELNVSMGYCWREGEIDVANQIAHTDELMYVDKQNYYSNHQELQYSHRAGLVKQLTHEIETGMFSVFLQPKIEAASGNIIGAEVQLRRIDDFGNYVPADIYIFRYEKEYIIRHIDFYIIETLCSLLQKWKNLILPDFKLSVHLSRITLLEHNIAQKLQKICQTSGVLPERIVLTITESFQDMDKGELFYLIRKLSEAGFSLSVDDFILKYKEYAEIIKQVGNSSITIVHTIKIYRELDSKIASLDDTFLLFGCEAGGKYYFEAPLSILDFHNRFILPN